MVVSLICDALIGSGDRHRAVEFLHESGQVQRVQPMNKTGGRLLGQCPASPCGRFRFADQVNRVRGSVDHRGSHDADDGVHHMALTPTHVRALHRLFASPKQRYLVRDPAGWPVHRVNSVVHRCHVDGVPAALGHYQGLAEDLTIKNRRANLAEFLRGHVGLIQC